MGDTATYRLQLSLRVVRRLDVRLTLPEVLRGLLRGLDLLLPK